MPTLSCFACLTLVISLTAPDVLAAAGDSKTVSPPNFLLVVADDLGWADIGAFGSKIRTPNIDSLAATGTVMSQFYAAPSCAPTRAMLLTGLSSHAAGVGTQNLQQAPNQQDSLQYQGQLHNGVVTLAEGLRSVGYQTMISGKWHIGRDPNQYPSQRGFDRSFILREGGASHFADQLPINPAEPAHYFEDGAPVDALPEDFYSTTYYTEKMLNFLAARDRGRPFFSYIAFTAPHDPLQVPDSWLNRYEGVFDEGPDAVRARRITALTTRGFFPDAATPAATLPLPPIFPGAKPAWSERSEVVRRQDVRPVEIYAAMIELMDKSLGQVLAYLEAEGELENTYIVFLSDNGVSAVTPLLYPGTSRQWLHEQRDMNPANAGRPRTHTFINGEWASALNGPLRLFKGTTAEGGIRVPVIVSGPRVMTGKVHKHLSHIADLTPTFYALAGLRPDTSPLYLDKPRPTGESLVATWEGSNEPRQAPIVVELFGNKAVRQDDWKLTLMAPPFGDNTWQLYNMAADPGETENVAEDYPAVAQRLLLAYQEHAETVGIIDPKPPLSRDISALYVGKCDLGCEARFLLLKALVDPSYRWLLMLTGIFLLLLIGLLAHRLLRS